MHTPSEILAPFVGAKLARPTGFTRNPDGSVSGMARQRVDIQEGFVDHTDADVRAVSADGVTIFFSSSAALIPWDRIGGIVVRAIADDGMSSRTVATWPTERRAAA